MKTSTCYFAGIFDGEGWFSIHRARAGRHRREFCYQLYAGLAIRNKIVIDLLKKEFGGSIQFHNLSAKNPKHSDVWRWVAVSRNAAAFASQVMPHLLVKRKQAKLAIMFQEHMRIKGRTPTTDVQYRNQSSMFNRMRTLNMKGVSRYAKAQ